jgi:fructokinase
MRKVIGAGEAVLDIIFRDNMPERALPGGSVFNSMVSLGRRGIPVLFIGELGSDRAGRLITDFMIDNQLSTEYIRFFEGNTPVSLAFADARQQVFWEFYSDFPDVRLPFKRPDIHADDMLLLSSYFAVNPALRKETGGLLADAVRQRAIVYYDINFRKPHAGERLQLTPAFNENFGLSTVVRCSSEDLEALFPGESAEEIYARHISPCCRYFIVTQGEGEILLMTGAFEKRYPVDGFVPVGAIGAGDGFNAGFIYAIMRDGVLLRDFEDLPEGQWDRLVESGKRFAAAVCRSAENYVPRT